MTIHTTRDSLDGIHRSRLRGTLRIAMGVKSNASIFESKGDPWETTPSQHRQDKVRQAKLEQHLREASLNETRFIGYLKAKLADDGLPSPVPVDKQQLAREKRKERAPMSCRSPSRNALTVALAKANRLAVLDKQLRENQAVNATLSKDHKNYMHFTKITGPIKPETVAEIWAAGQARCIGLLTYIILSHGHCPTWDKKGQNKGA
jgi:hypothetical protein